jgi:hypothetical protein
MDTKVKQVICYRNDNDKKLYRVGNGLFKNISYTENIDEATDYYEDGIMKHLYLTHFRNQYPRSEKNKINIETTIYISGKMDASFGGLLRKNLHIIWLLIREIFVILFKKKEA